MSAVPPALFDPRALGAMCHLCPLSEKRACAPTGPLDAPVVFVGEGPARYEELHGKVFQGDSGQKLGVLLYKHGVTRDQVYVTNALLCRAEAVGIEGKRRFEMKTYVAWFRKQNMLRKKQGFEQQLNPFECCFPRLKWELDWLDFNAKKNGRPNGVVIVPLGNFALEAVTRWRGFTDKVTGIMKYRGSVL